ncbi:MAG: ParA family protein [Candidatus Adiutrix sp.]
MVEIIAIVNQKGGVGKTTSAINIAACLAAIGKKTLLIDADPQGNSTSGLGISKQNLNESFYDFLIENTPLNKIVMETSIPDLYILPSNRDSLALGRALLDTPGRELQLRTILKEELSLSPYDFVIMDSPPNLEILSINIMVAANRLIIPTQPEYYGLEGLADLIETYKRIRETINPSLSILGVLITMYSANNNLSKEVTQNLRENMGNLIFNTIIPRNVRLAEAPSYCQSIITYDPKSSGSLSYQALTKEIMERTGN